MITWWGRAAALASWLALPLTPAIAAQNGDWWEGLTEMPPGFHVIEVDSVYTISGFTISDVLGDMHRKGPGIDDIGVRLGLHVSQWRYSYEYTRGGSRRCRLTEAQVLLRSVILLPEWTDVSRASHEVASGWHPFVRALTVHEEGHRSRALMQGVTLWTALLGLQASNCDELESLVRTTADRVLADGMAAQVAYDRETEHGAKQGATWP